MDTDQTLQEIQESLQPKPQPKPKAKPTTGKPAAAVDLTQALLKLPLMLTELQKLTFEKQREADAVVALQNLELTVQKLLVATETNLKLAASVDARLKRRVDSLDVVEAKWQLVITRVSNMLDELERVLKQL